MVCGLVRFISMALVNEVKRTGTATESSVYQTSGGIGGMGGRAAKTLVGRRALAGRNFL